MPTMRQVADHAGVSIATVSFVVNNTKPVTAATRARIEASMAELGYRPNAVARALASRRTRILALAYPALDHRLGGSGMEFMNAAAQAAGELGYHLMIWPGANDGTELTELVGQQLVDGVILMEVQLDDPRVPALQSSGTPYALIGRTAEASDSLHVDIDFEQTIRDALQHLCDLGHRRIVFATGSQAAQSYYNYGPYVRSEQAYRDEAGRRGIEPVIVESGQDAAAGRLLARRLLDEHPGTTAVLLLNEFAAIGLLTQLVHQGVAVPDDLSIVSMLTSRELAGYTQPSLTIMNSPGTGLGRLAVEHLVREMLTGDRPDPVLLPSTLVVGGSTAPPPAGARRR
ncbi:MAG TPA: LacI family DNA-binding transcriptional regulator [Microlunatus sp.]|nr:LacI family DNA-binding transcriptional regulator [Microlunatus sp.]